MTAKSHGWKALWAGKSADADILRSGDREQIFLELKRSCGFDAIGGGLSYASFLEQYRWIKANLLEGCPRLQTVFEVGCGSGGNLLLLEADGFTCGGIDYSPKLTACAKLVLRTKDLLCAEADALPAEPQYDAVFSNSVFSYFTDEVYAASVLEKMCRKARHAVGVIDIHDREKQEAFFAYRRAASSDYEERYKNLPKLFYDKQFFIEFARTHDLQIRIADFSMQGYWNNDFVFHCFLYPRPGA